MDYRQKCLNAKGDSCRECGSKEEIEVHHIDTDRWNNDLDNLIPLCHECHMAVHRGEEGFEHLTDQLENKQNGGAVSEEVVEEAFSRAGLDSL